MNAAAPQQAKELYDYFVQAVRQHLSRVETGVFGAMMHVELTNEGPVTLILERAPNEAKSSPSGTSPTLL